MTQPKTRVEQDAIGSLAVPAQALFGVQTQRAVNLYPLCGEKPLSAYPELIWKSQTNLKAWVWIVIFKIKYIPSK